MNTDSRGLFSEVEVISLDLFDTLLGRRCTRPEDVFLAIEEQLVREYGDVFRGFSVLRRDIDSEVRRRVWENRQSEEILLTEIYDCLLEWHPDWPSTRDYLVNLELETEARYLYPLDSGREWMAAAKEAGMRVILVSDIYLPKSFCEDLLHRHGLVDYEAIFISSEIGLLKHTGHLFEHVTKALGVEPAKILHVGDNPHSDGIQAQAAGWRSHILPKAIDTLDRFERNPWSERVDKAGSSVRESILIGMSARGCLRESSFDDPFWYRIGYQVAGPIVYGYLRFLLRQVEGRHLGKIFFLSRDGFILKQVYEIISDGIEDAPAAEYLYASRRALNFASIEKLDRKAEDWLVEGIRLKVADFLQRVGLSPADFTREISEVGFRSADQAVVEGQDYDSLRALFRLIEPALLAAAKKEREAYLGYLKTMGVFEESPFVMVDVGWMTSIQYSFAKLFSGVKPDFSIEGFFLGTYPEAVHRQDSQSRHQHYLMAYGEPKATFETIRHCVCLLEFFFAAPERTFLSIKASEDGSFHPEFASFHENEEDLPALKMIHDGILEYVREIHGTLGLAGPEVTAEEAMRLLHRILADPTEEEAARLGELHYADGYGSYFHHTCMARPSNFAVRGINKKIWKEEFKATHWPRGYYMRLHPWERWIFDRFHPNARFSKRYG